MADRNPLRESLDEGEIVDERYAVQSRIGSGGMADVYCAHDSQLGRKVALKVLHRRFAADQEFVERFRREASAAAGLQHPNVVQVFDRGELDGTYYIAMEFLEGRSLKQLVRDEGQLDPGRAIDITIQILRAARFAHKRGIIHRDIKPHNVIIDAEGRVKVTDFGIARAGASDMTETGAIMGTAQYLSPEQAQGHTVSASSDLYSVGILLYELLTARVPFDAESAVTIALKQVNEEPMAPRALNAAVSPELEDVVLRAMQKDPARRFADADDFIGALEMVREAPARPDVGQRTGSFTGVYPALGEEIVERERRGLRFWLAMLALLLLLAGGAVAAYLLTRPDLRTVPNVIGQGSAAASQRLINEGFEVEIEQVQSEVPEDRVTRQRPGPDEEVEVGSTITITVSSGPGEETIPEVLGKPRAEAVELLEDRGFDVTEEQEFSEGVPRGRALGTRPEVGSQLDIGSTVILVISRGREKAAVPDVVGLEESEARAQLQESGFNPVVTREESDDIEPGEVLSTDPAAGTELTTGSNVTVTVAEEPDDVPVPNVRGQQVDDASATLRAAGFSVVTELRTVPNPDGEGLVLQQRPGGGRLPKGGTVTLVVGEFDDSQLDPDPTATPEPTQTAEPTPTPTPE